MTGLAWWLRIVLDFWVLVGFWGLRRLLAFFVVGCLVDISDCFRFFIALIVSFCMCMMAWFSFSVRSLKIF